MVLVWLIGAGVGLLGGLFGKGGSAVATPLLHLAGAPAFAALASPLPATVPATAAAAATYWRGGYIDRRVLAWTVSCGLSGARPRVLGGPGGGGGLVDGGD